MDAVHFLTEMDSDEDEEEPNLNLYKYWESEALFKYVELEAELKWPCTPPVNSYK